MDTILYEVAVLTHYTKRDLAKDVADIFPINHLQKYQEPCDLGMSEAFAYPQVALPDFTKPPPFWPNSSDGCDSFQRFTNTLEHVGASTENVHFESDPNSISDYMSAHEPEVEDDEKDKPEISEVSMSDTESSGYVSASSSLMEYIRGRSSVSSSEPSSRSSSLSDSSRSSFSSDSSSGLSSLSDADSISRGSEDNFADIESNESLMSLEGRQKQLSRRAKYRQTKKKFVTPLETIFSPMAERISKGCSESTSAEDSGQNSVGGVCGDTTDCSSMPSETLSDASSSALNPLSQPFIPRSLRFPNGTFLSGSGSDSDEFGTGNTIFTNVIVKDPKLEISQNDSHMTAYLTESNSFDDIGTRQTAVVNTNDSGFASQTLLSEFNSTFDRSYLENRLEHSANSAQTTFAHMAYEQTHCEMGSIVARPYELSNAEDSSCVSGHHSFYTANTSMDINTASQSPLEGLCLANIKSVDKGPYDCGINHRNDFCCMKMFSIADLPSCCQTFKIWDTVMSVSHRVVRLCVAKPTNVICLDSKASNSDNSHDEQFDHYATGFVYFINRDYLEVRTHLHVVSSPEEACKTRVTFNLDVQNRFVADIDCFGLEGSYRSNVHSQSCAFRCKTPTSLLEHLYLFKDIPMKYNNLYYDSSYFSDSSPDISFDLENDILTNDILLSSGLPHNWNYKVPSTMVESESNSDLLSDIVDSLDTPAWVSYQLPGTEWDTPAWVSYQLPGKEWDIQSIQEAVDSLSEELKSVPRENPFAYCGVEENIVKNAFESVNPFQYDVPPIFEAMEIANWPEITMNDFIQHEPPTPLSIMEKKATGRDGTVCPYEDLNVFKSVGEYGNFSSHAGDVLEKSLPVFGTCPSLSPYADSQGFGRWEYEGLVHAQTHHREAYNRSYNVVSMETAEEYDSTAKGDIYQPIKDNTKTVKPEVIVSTDPIAACEGDEFSPETKKILADLTFSTRSPTTHPAFTMDSNRKKRILGGNDTLESCNFEDMVDRLVAEDDDRMSSQTCSKPKKTDVFCLIVSYPHGGEKMVSVGKFSSHRHFGGELYDTPTCMGACGAPIISVGRGGEGAYLTQLIHAGTGKVNGITCGMAVSHFDD